MIVSFQDQGTEDIYNGTHSKSARRACPEQIWDVARRKLDQLRRATMLRDLSAPPNNRLQRLKGDRQGQHSIRINDQYRVCFFWTENGPANVEITDYH